MHISHELLCQMMVLLIWGQAWLNMARCTYADMVCWWVTGELANLGWPRLRRFGSDPHCLSSSKQTSLGLFMWQWQGSKTESTKVYFLKPWHESSFLPPNWPKQLSWWSPVLEWNKLQCRRERWWIQGGHYLGLSMQLICRIWTDSTHLTAETTPMGETHSWDYYCKLGR